MLYAYAKASVGKRVGHGRTGHFDKPSVYERQPLQMAARAR